MVLDSDMPITKTTAQQLKARFKGKSIKSSPVDDFTWVYDNVTMPKPDLDSIPSVGAYGLYEWAKNNQDKFYDKFISVMAKLADEQVGEREQGRRHDDITSHISKLLDECLPACAEEHRRKPTVPPEPAKQGDDGFGNEADLLAGL